MTVFAFEANDPENPIGPLSAQEIERLPFGAAELTAEGKVVAYNDTEPDSSGGERQSILNRDFFTDVARWAGHSVIAEEFRKGVANGDLNVVFDCSAPKLPYRVRLHLKVSPILGTYWAFIKRLQRAG